ncbi:MAG: hypothetical protein OXQ86_08110 [Gammaproteobacteria bacterium]|nr:hypothetical protein [Gammaproteobacteria bacterium]MDE0412888.1 hypothetical protein [Gammaproteobacteria bacterium]
MRTKTKLAALLIGATALVALVSESTSNEGEEFEKLYGQFYEHDNAYAEVIARSEEHFENMNVEGAILSLDDDFTMYEINDEGAEEMVRGIEQVRAALSGVFGSGTWLGANVYKWGLTDNTLVQIEEDFYRTEDGGTRSVKSLVVVEYRDGRRWREWRFKPEDR